MKAIVFSKKQNQIMDLIFFDIEHKPFSNMKFEILYYSFKDSKLDGVIQDVDQLQNCYEYITKERA